MTFPSFTRAISRDIRTNGLPITCGVAFLVLCQTGVRAQPVNTYGFTQGAGTYSSISGGTVLISGTSWNNAVFTVALPTPFWFSGQSYSTMYVSANGFLTFGSAPSTNNNSPINNNGGYSGAVSPFGADLQDANLGTSEVRWQEVGNEIVVQWRNAQRKIGGNTEAISFQARLNTVNGVIRFVYSAVTNLNSSTQKQPEVGLRGPNNTFATNVCNRTVGTGSETWASTLTGTANNSTLRFSSTAPSRSPSSGQTYTFTPPCVGAQASAVLGATNCMNGTFVVTVSVTSLGSGPNVDIVASPGGTLFNDVGTGVYTCTLNNGTSAAITVKHNNNTACDVALGSFINTATCLTNGICVSPVLAIADNACGPGTYLDASVGMTGLPTILGGSPGQGRLESVDVIVDHPARGELNLTLISPTGQQRDLFLRRPAPGATGNHLGNPGNCPTGIFRFKDGAASLSTLSSNANNVTGTFAPEQTLLGFTGDPNGTWTLRICDAAGGNVGDLRYVKLNFVTVDCNNVPGGMAVPGAACNDGDPCTLNDLWSSACQCTGTPGNLSANATVTTPIACNGGNATVTVSASGGTAPYTGTGTFTRAAGTYTFTVTDANGCSTTASATVTQPSAMSATASVTAPIACNGGNATVTVSASGGTAPYTGTGAFTRAAGTYSFTVTDSEGCSTTASVTVTQPAALIASATITTPIGCHGGIAFMNVSASGGTAPYSGTGTTLRTAGTYTFNVTDGMGCLASRSLTIAEPTALFASAVVVSLETSCGASDAVVSVSASGGTPTYSGIGTHIGLTAGSPVFVITDANNCLTTAVLNIPEPDSDGDGTGDCGDQCPNDPAKVNPGQCGCGIADMDTDGDTYANCVDGCPLDPLKIGPGACGCGQADADTDNDGILDCFDACPAGPEPGSPCNDGNPSTINDVVANNCICTGSPSVAGYETLQLHLTTDGNGPQTSWEIVPLAGGNALCSGVSLPSNTTTVLPCQVPDGAYVLRILDSAGDGMCCTNGSGSFTLTTSDGRRIIDASDGATFGSLSSVPLGFTLPLGTDRLTPSRCDREDLLPSDFIQATPNDAVRAQYGVNGNSGYQFWIFDPNGGYSRRMLITHANASYIFPTGPDRCSYLRLSHVVTDPIPSGRTLNVRVRSMVNGIFNAFGSTCRLRIDLPGSCPVTQLVNDPSDPHHSCGISSVMLDGSRWLYAVPVSQVTHYQFEFSSTNYLRRVSSPGCGLLLSEWAQLPLEYGMKLYSVRVRVSYDNQVSWCPFGPSCNITTAPGAPTQPRALTIIGSDPADLRIWPNPLREGDLNVLLAGLRQDETSAQLTMIDLQGRVIADQRIAAQEGILNVQLTAQAQLPAGTYLITIRTTDRSWTERVVVE